MKRLFPACGLFGALLLMSGCGKSNPEVPSWFKGDKKDATVTGKNTPEQLQADLKTKIRKLEMKQAALDDAISGVERSKAEIKTKLNSRGIRDSKDLNKPENKDDEEVQRMVKALIKKSKEHEKYRQMRKEYGIALFDGKDALESLERQLKLAKAGFTEKEMEDFAVTIRKIDERLDATDAATPVDLKDEHDIGKILKAGN